MFKKFAILMVILGLGLGSCKKNQTPDEWSITGSVMQTDSQVPSIQSPLAGIQVYLLNLDFGVDTLTSQFLQTDIIDSALTDADGSYHFDLVLPGDYIVLPNDTTGRYNFSWSESPDSIWMMNDSDHSEFEINFATPEPVLENGLTFTFSFKNTNDDLGGIGIIELYRECRCWEFKGFGDWGIPQFGWSDWYWTWKRHISDTYDDQMNNEFPSFSWILLKYENNGLYEYQDVYYIKFFESGIFSSPTWLKTMRVAGDDLKENNSFKVVWGPGSVVNVTRD